MLVSTIAGRRYVRFQRLAAEAGLSHAFSTRPRDVSARVDGGEGERDRRRRQMAADLELDPDRLFYAVQVHGTGIAILDGGAVARGTATRCTRVEGVDALITDQPDVALMTFSADCPLVLVYDPVRRTLGMVHSSWRCTVTLSTQRLVEAMVSRFACRPRDLLAGIGPAAGPQRYEVGADVYEAAARLPQRERFFAVRAGRMHFDLWEANRAQLVGAGVPESHIEIAGICTMTDTELFYSYRREGAGCGHFGLMAGLRRAPA